MPPTTNLSPGMTGPEVQKLQNFLRDQGYLTQAQINTGYGNYGPQTTAAVKAYQNAMGVDNSSGPGYWGPKTRAAATGGATSGANPYTPEQYKQALMENSLTSSYISHGNTVEQLQNAFETGDFSQMTDENGQPFSTQDRQDALKKAQEMDEAYYTQLKEKETADAESTLAQQQADYQNYLATSATDFAEDKTASDQNAANTGVLFSGARVQKEQSMKNKYDQDQAYKQQAVGRNIADTARDYQYKYGNDAASGLSQYYKLGGNTYNPNVATGGVSSNNLSSIYNPSQNNFAGTRIGEKMATANKKASGLLWNRGNKLLSSGYNNQYK
jgi:peptidoglycan hydrolase-like protein with peptidoglycan-binding domain